MQLLSRASKNWALQVHVEKDNSILDDGVKRKTAHCLRVTCASSLFNAGVEEKLIRERTEHRSNTLFKYEKPSEENKGTVSYLLGPNAVFLFNAAFHEGTFQNCNFHIVNNCSKKVENN